MRFTSWEDGEHFPGAPFVDEEGGSFESACVYVFEFGMFGHVAFNFFVGCVRSFL